MKKTPAPDRRFPSVQFLAVFVKTCGFCRPVMVYWLGEVPSASLTVAMVGIRVILH
jgi:hypothetical protein